MTTNLQRTVTVKNTITVLLTEVNSIRFDKNLPRGENTTEYDRTQKTSEEEVRNEVFSLCDVIIVRSYEVL
jgi:hypothetical protein